MSRSRGPLRIALGLVLVALGATGVAAPALAGTDAGSGTPLSVTITDGSTPAPTSSTSSPSGSGSTGGGSPTGGSPSSGTRGAGASTGGAGTTSGSSTGGSTDPAGGTTTPAGAVSAGGGLFIGGLNGAGTPAVNPGGGTVDVWFTVYNASGSTIDARADFWMDVPIFGNRLDGADDVAIDALQPGESRVVSARLRGAGQWTLLATHVTFTPPETVDGIAVTAVTRDALVPVFPWLVVLVLVLLILAAVIVRIVRAALPPVPAAAMP
ncbi:hypothetical protein Q9R20_10780 [Microbacterium sp. PRF11]|uniref:hypothetical protein n=1 Tax=Microbacterium sp. PRF11 TaxID=2962593 RepID=UPI002882AA62|nr:hypothetical protein [Microbacterium sp. PRF11]MDT0117474.1 hypothetical protein [Microbacterium sp. PRF11]